MPLAKTTKSRHLHRGILKPAEKYAFSIHPHDRDCRESWKVLDKITVAVEKKILHFREPFKIAYEEVETAEVILLKLSISDDIFGLGSAAPDTAVTGESVDMADKILRRKLTNDFFSLPINNWYGYHEKIQRVFKGFPAAQAAVEEAFLNLWSSYREIPLADFFGGYRKDCDIMITIGIKDEPATIKETERRLKEGFTIIKLKCGTDIDEDIKKIKAVKKILPKKARLILDANQGYSLPEAKKLLISLKTGGISLIEQPISAKNIGGLKELHLMNIIPVIADEAAVSVADAIFLLTNDYVAGVNIKLMKCGGPVNFLKIFHLAKSLNKIIMLGCMYESNVSITTGANIALGLPVDYADLDSGHLDFCDDPARGGVEIRRGKIRVTSPPSI